MPNQVIVDLPDFIPEEYTVAFSIQGERFVVKYGEATVDEVLVMMAEGDHTLNAKQLIDHRRRIVSEFYSAHLSEGEPEKLRSGLAFVPYQSNRGSLDIFTLYQNLTAQYPKKELGEAEREPLPSQSGLLASLRSFFGRARGV